MNVLPNLNGGMTAEGWLMLWSVLALFGAGAAALLTYAVWPARDEQHDDPPRYRRGEVVAPPRAEAPVVDLSPPEWWELPADDGEVAPLYHHTGEMPTLNAEEVLSFTHAWRLADLHRRIGAPA